MAIHYASELDANLYDEQGEQMYTWDDDYGCLGEIDDNDWNPELPKKYYYYHVFTPIEFEMARRGKELGAREALVNSSPERLDTVEETQASSDEAICELYELIFS